MSMNVESSDPLVTSRPPSGAQRADSRAGSRAKSSGSTVSEAEARTAIKAGGSRNLEHAGSPANTDHRSAATWAESAAHMGSTLRLVEVPAGPARSRTGASSNQSNVRKQEMKEAIRRQGSTAVQAGETRMKEDATDNRYNRWKSLAVGGAALALLGGLAACTSPDGADPSAPPTATPSASATLSERQQQIAAAEQALRDYIIASEEASRTLAPDTSTLMGMVTPTWWSEEAVPELNRNFDLNLVTTGRAELVTVRPVKVDLEPSMKSVKFRVCKDVTEVRYVKAEGKNKGKTVYNPVEDGTPRFEMTYTFVYNDDLDRWRLASYLVPLDEDGESTPC